MATGRLAQAEAARRKAGQMTVLAAAGTGALGTVLVGTVLVGAAVLAGPARAGTSATTAPGWHRATEIALPPGAPAGIQDAGLAAVSCPRSGTCEAGGFYESALGVSAAMVVTWSKGRWQRAQRLRLPSGAAVASQTASVAALTCRAPGDCEAVGYYQGGTGARQLIFAAAQNRGRWARASRIQLPSGAAGNPQARLGAVACPAAGGCVAVGDYTTAAGNQQLIAAAQQAGRWGRARRITAPADGAADPAPFLAGLACRRPGSCQAVGSYTDRARQGEPLAVAESGGRWRRASRVGLPADAASGQEAGLDAVACPSAAACLATGSYTDRAGRVEPLAVTHVGGRWVSPVRPPLPARANARPEAFLDGAGCLSARSCVASGSYLNRAGHYQAMALAWSGGHSAGRDWGHAVQVPAPANATTGTFQDVELFAAACAPGGPCAAVGYYQDDAGHYQAMAAVRR